MIEFWMLLVHALHGQYDDLQGSTDVLLQRQVAFKNQWQGLHLFSDTTSCMKWNYVIPPFMLHNLNLLFYIWHHLFDYTSLCITIEAR